MSNPHLQPPPSTHRDRMEHAGYWRQFVFNYYFDEPGDSLGGELVKLYSTGAGDDRVPVLRIRRDDGVEFIVTARQARLASELAVHAPAVGDRIRITFTGEAQRSAPGMSKAKEFEVRVQRAGSPTSARPALEGEAGAENAPTSGGKASK